MDEGTRQGPEERLKKKTTEMEVNQMSKLIPLADAISQYVHDGDTIYAAGFTHLIPFAAGHEIIRQNKQELVLARATPDLIYDQMVAAGCARKVIFSYMGNPGVGSLRIIRAAIEKHELEWKILPLWDDLTFAGRRGWSPIHADEIRASIDLDTGQPAHSPRR